MIARITKPPKPYPTFPLFPHARGYWRKSIDGRHASFGKWEWPNRDAYERSWRAALATLHKYLEDVAHRRLVVGTPERLTIGALVDAYLACQNGRAVRREIKCATYAEAKGIVTHFRDFVEPTATIADLEAFTPQRPDACTIRRYVDAMKAKYAWHAFNKRMVVLSGLWTWAEDPVTGVLGRAFRLKAFFSKRAEVQKRREREEQRERFGLRRWTVDELNALFAHAPMPLRAMLELQYFAGFGNSDCADLYQAAIEFEPDAGLGLPAGAAVIHFPRPKTLVERAAVLPDFVAVHLREAIAGRPAPADPAWRNRVFLTRRGLPWVRGAVHEDPDRPGEILKVVSSDAIAQEFARLRDRLARCPAHGWFAGGEERGQGFRSDVREVPRAERRPRPPTACPTCGGPVVPMRKLGAYTFRHTAITFASGSADPDALALFAGHVLPGMRASYVEEVETTKLQRIAERLVAKLRTPAASFQTC